MNLPTFPPIPFDTVEAARAIFGSGNTYLVIGDQLDALFDGIRLENPARSSQKQIHRLAVLYLCTIFQYMESLPDQFTVNALRERIDWKYALHMDVNSFPVQPYLLCEFRKMVTSDPAIQYNFNVLLERLCEIPQVALNQNLCQDAHQVIEYICRISRLTNIWETIHLVLEAVATRNPEWLRAHSRPYWYERYNRNRRILYQRTERKEQDDFAQAIGGDGFYLLEEINRSGEEELAGLSEVSMLRQIWSDQYDWRQGKALWKGDDCLSCLLSSHMRISAGVFPHHKGG